MKRFLFVLCFVLCSSSIALGQKIASPPILIIGPQGRPVPGATASIVDSMGQPATTWTNKTGSNAFNGIIPPNGMFQFFADPGSYTVNVSGSGITFIFSIDIIAGGGDGGGGGLVSNDFPYELIPPGQFNDGWSGYLARENNVFRTVRNFVTTTDPGPADDKNEGFDATSMWINSTADRVWIATAGSQSNGTIWKDVSGGSSGGGGTITGGNNLTTSNRIFSGVDGTTMQFRTLEALNGVVIIESGNTLQIGATSALPSGVSFANALYYSGDPDIGWSPTDTVSIWPAHVYAGAKLDQLPTDTGTVFSIGSVPNTTSGVSMEMSTLDTDIQPQDGLGRIQFRGKDSFAEATIGAVIRAKADGVWTSSPAAVPTKLEFLTPGTVDGFSIPKLLIDNNGFVRIGRIAASVAYDPVFTTGGVGEANPEKLHVTNGLRLIGFSNGTTGIKMNPSQATNWTMQLPDTDGNPGEALVTNGAGITSWASPPTGLHAATHNEGGTDPVQYYDRIQEDGTNLTKRRVINFTGGGVTCTDVGGLTQCAIPGGGGGSGITSINTLTDAAITFNTNTSGTDFAVTTSGTGTVVLNLPVASITQTGKMSTIAQTFAGLKGFNEGLETNSDGDGAGSLKAVGDNINPLFEARPATDTVGIRAAPDGAQALLISPSNAMNGLLINNPAAPRGATIYGSITAVEGITGGTGSAFEAFASTGIGYKAALTTDAKALFLTRNVAASNKPVAEIQQLNTSNPSPALAVTNKSSNFNTMEIIRDGSATGFVANNGDLKIYGRTTGIPAVGIGSSLYFYGEDATNADRAVATITGVSTDISAAGFSSLLSFGTHVAGGLTNSMVQIGSNKADDYGVPYLPLLVTRFNANNAGDPNIVLRANTTATGSAAVGLGSSIMWDNELPTGLFKQAAHMRVQWTSIAPDDEEAKIVFNVAQNGFPVDKMTVASHLITLGAPTIIDGVATFNDKIIATHNTVNTMIDLTQNNINGGIMQLTKLSGISPAINISAPNGVSVDTSGAAGNAYHTLTGVGNGYHFDQAGAGIGILGSMTAGTGQMLKLTSTSNSAAPGLAFVEFNSSGSTADRILLRLSAPSATPFTSKPLLLVDNGPATADVFSIRRDGAVTIGGFDPTLPNASLVISGTRSNLVRVSATGNTTASVVFDIHQSEVADFTGMSKVFSLTQYGTTPGSQSDQAFVEYIGTGGQQIFLMETDGMPIYPGNNPEFRENPIQIIACGTSPLGLQLRNAGGVLQVGTGTVTSCTLNLQENWVNLPSCLVTGGNDGSSRVYVNTVIEVNQCAGGDFAGAVCTSDVTCASGGGYCNKTTNIEFKVPAGDNMAGAKLRYMCMAFGV